LLMKIRSFAHKEEAAVLHKTGSREKEITGVRRFHRTDAHPHRKQPVKPRLIFEVSKRVNFETHGRHCKRTA